MGHHGCRYPNHRNLRRGVLVVALLFGFAPTFAQDWSESVAETAESRRQQYEQISAEVDFLERQGNLLKRVVRFVRPTVVHIEAARVDNDRKGVDVEEAGSGVIVEIRKQPYILTNRHVIKDSIPSRIKIKLADGRLVFPTKVWSDRGTDIAVMAVSAPQLVAANIGQSDKIEIGDFVVAVGSPFGLSHSVTYGIISAKGRRDLQLGDDGVRFQDFLQTDAAINPGNSGGPLLNLRGEVIGLNTAIASSSGGNEGIGFTIPIDMAMSVAKQLIERGAVVRAFWIPSSVPTKPLAWACRAWREPRYQALPPVLPRNWPIFTLATSSCSSTADALKTMATL